MQMQIQGCTTMWMACFLYLPSQSIQILTWPVANNWISRLLQLNVSFSEHRIVGQQETWRGFLWSRNLGECKFLWAQDSRTTGRKIPREQSPGSRVLWGDLDLSPPSIRGSTRVGVGVGDHGMGWLCHGNQPNHSPNQHSRKGTRVGQVRSLSHPCLVIEIACFRRGV